MSKPMRLAAAMVGFAVGFFFVRVGITMAHRPSDEVQIHQALNEAIEASKKGQPGGVMDLLSRQLKFNDQSIVDQSTIRKVIRESHPDVTVQDQKILVTGSEATIVSPVDFKGNIFGQDINQHIDHVTLVFRREEVRDYFFLPSSRWKLSAVRLPENQIPNVSG